jgi:hypothetical protein
MNVVWMILGAEAIGCAVLALGMVVALRRHQKSLDATREYVKRHSAEVPSAN